MANRGLDWTGKGSKMPSCFEKGEEDREEDFDRGIHEPRSTAMLKNVDGNEGREAGESE